MTASMALTIMIQTPTNPRPIYKEIATSMGSSLPMGHQWDRLLFFSLRRDTRVTTRMTKIVSSKYKNYEENMGNFTKLLLLIIQHTMNELNSVSV